MPASSYSFSPNCFEARLLIVDDCVRHAASLQGLLNSHGYVYTDVASNPQKVNDLHRESNYDLILLDLQMPVLDGIGVMQCLKQNHENDFLPVMVVTAYTSLKNRALSIGALDVLIKPYNLEEMLLRVRNALNIRLAYKSLNRHVEQHKSMAMHDPLTGLPNRNLILDRIKTAVQYAMRTAKLVAVLYIDLDGFKAVNDTFGHAHGDTLLKLVASRLCNSARQTDTVGRIGGDEFVMVLSEVRTVEEASIPARKIIQALVAPFRVREESLIIGASIGIAVFPQHANSAEDLLEHADKALYRVKRSGKNNFQFV